MRERLRMRRVKDFRHSLSRTRRTRRRLLPRVSGMRLAHVVPNGITLVAVCSGVLGLLFGLQGSWGIAVVAVLVAVACDSLDGRMARVLGGASHFGAELDSLSDMLAFGLCPVMIVYLWGMEAAGIYGVMGVLVFVVCCMLRLARFNVTPSAGDMAGKMGLVWSNYFQGVPSTMAGFLVLLPVVFDLAWEEGDVMSLHEFMPFVLVLWCLILGFFMVSSFPVFTFKSVRVSRGVVLYAMAAGVPLMIATLVSSPWYFLLFLQLFSLFVLPVSVYGFLKLRRAVEALRDEEEGEGEGENIVSLQGGKERGKFRGSQGQ